MKLLTKSFYFLVGIGLFIYFAAGFFLRSDFFQSYVHNVVENKLTQVLKRDVEIGKIKGVINVRVFDE